MPPPSPTAYLTRIVEFTATHRFPDTPEFSGATDDHSHRYKCAVTVRGTFDPSKRGVMSLQILKSLLQREIVARFDGRHLNTDIPAFATGKFLATGEALAVYVWERLAGQLPAGVALHCVRIEESPHLYSEYRGEA